MSDASFSTLENRDYALQVITEDKFLEMNYEAQLIYIHLVMKADDDGIVYCPKATARMVVEVGESREYLQELVENLYIVLDSKADLGDCTILLWPGRDK